MTNENDTESLVLVGLGVGHTFEWDISTSTLPTFIVPVDEVIVGAVTYNQRYQSLFAPVTRSLWRQHAGDAERIIRSVIEPIGFRYNRNIKLLLPESPETSEMTGVGAFEGSILDIIRPVFRSVSDEGEALLSRPNWHQPGTRFKDEDLHTESVVNMRLRGWVLNDQVPGWARSSFKGLQMIGSPSEHSVTITEGINRIIDYQGSIYGFEASHLRLKMPPHFPPPAYILAGCVVHHGQYIHGLQPIYRRIEEIAADTGGQLHHGPVYGREHSGGHQDTATVLLAPPGQCVLGYQGRSGKWMDAFGLIYGDPITGSRTGQTEVLGGLGGSPFPPRMSSAAVRGVITSGGDYLEGIAFLVPLDVGYNEEGSEVEL
eukprot:gnl/Dysnectes_brevis/5283_a7532_462.p1 GENE.gnl/Dysnectes_brevis/5283_a7532_462~~gnl/Dysnectes_brevis/5283_a7532_462.p1  ORF type:complete len:373 (+),score=65.04 gnl/Dysnectes_brevis/5283_a7532_462:111-1229(+)